jgi:YggT family protein
MIAGTIAAGLLPVVSGICFFIKLLIIASVVVSFVGDPNNQLVQTIYRITEPMYRPFRRITSKLPGPLDWAPMLLFLLVFAIENSLTYLLVQLTRG